MKKWIASLVIFCALTVGVFVLILNVLGGTSLKIDKSQWEKVDNISHYTVVYNPATAGFSDYENSVCFNNNPAKVLANGLKAINPSWNVKEIKPLQGYTHTGNTIYVCNTADTSSNLGGNGFVVRKTIDGIIRIEGSNNNSIIAGVNFFLRECVIEGKDGLKDIYVPTGSGYRFSYNTDSNKIEDVDLSKFYIVVDDSQFTKDENNKFVDGWNILEKAQKIQNKICSISNVLLPIVPETNKIKKHETAQTYDENFVDKVESLTTQSHEEIKKGLTYVNEIYISGFSNLRSDAIEILESLKDSEYYVGIKNGKLLILGKNALALQAACDYFLAELNTVEEGRFLRLSSNSMKEKTEVVQYSSITNIFVDSGENGNDANDGSSQENAVKTLYKAIDILGEAVKSAGKNFAQINICLLDGTYYANNYKISVPHNISVNIKSVGENGAVINGLTNINVSNETKSTYQFTDSQEDNNYNTYSNIRQVYTLQNGTSKMMQMAESETYKFPEDENKVLTYTDAEVAEFHNELAERYITPGTVKGSHLKYPVDYINRRIYVDKEIYDELTDSQINGYEEIWLGLLWKNSTLKIEGVGEEVLTFGSSSETCYYVTIIDEGLTGTADKKIGINKLSFYAMYHSMTTQGFSFCGSGKSYKILNSLEYLTSSTYVYDNINTKLYFGTNLSNKTIQVANSSILLNITGANNITFDGITFTGAEYKSANNGVSFGQSGMINWATPITSAIYGTNVSNITIKNCTFKELSSNAIQIKGRVSNLNIDTNRFENIGMSAINIGSEGVSKIYSEWEKTAVRNLKISNNYIENTGSKYVAFSAIFVTKGDGIKILKNTITNTSYTAISVGFGWGWSELNNQYLETVNVNRAEIAYNNITEYMQVLKDGGAIYILGANCSIGYTNHFNFIHHNFANNKKQQDNCYVYYLDATSSNWKVYNNVAGGGYYALYSQSQKNTETHNNEFTNNYVLKGSVKVHVGVNRSDTVQYTQRNIVVNHDSTKEYGSNDKVVDDIRKQTGSSLGKN